MELVVDTNVLISAIISKQSTSRKLLFLSDGVFCAPHFALTEIDEHKEEIMKKSSLSNEELEIILTIFSMKINYVAPEQFNEHIQKAKEICPDEDDIEFFALCLAKSLPLWSNDKKLKEQNAVKVLNTDELVKILKTLINE